MSEKSEARSASERSGSAERSSANHPSGHSPRGDGERRDPRDAPEPPTDSQAVPSPEDGPQYCAYTEYRPGEVPEDAVVPKNGADSEGLERAVWDALFEVEDPEMPVSVVDLGLIYDVAVTEDEAGTHAEVTMTLTYTGCPARDMLLDDVREAAAAPRGIDAASVELVWSPVWSVAFVSEAGREDLREFGVSI